MNKKIVGLIALIIAVPLVIFLAMFSIRQTETDKTTEDTEVSEIEKVEDESQRQEDTEEVKDEEPHKEATVGEVAPDFSLKNLDGEDVSLSDFRGKKVLINFWATTCKYCVIEMPDLNKVDQENEDVVVLAVDVMEEQKKVKDYIEEGGYDFKVLLDTKGDVSRNYLVRAFPTTYGIDEDGVIAIAIPGMLTKEQMEQVIVVIDENKTQ